MTLICSQSREQVEDGLECWRYALVRSGMKAGGGKTEYVCVNERETVVTGKMQRVEVHDFKYMLQKDRRPNWRWQN